MGIRCYCPNGHKLNVKPELAGKVGVCPICKLRFQIPLGIEQTPNPQESTTPATSQTIVEQRLTKPTSPVSQKSTLSQTDPVLSNEQNPVNESRITNKSVSRQEDDQGQSAPNFSFNQHSDTVQTFLGIIINIFNVITYIILFVILFAISLIPFVGIIIAIPLALITFGAIWCNKKDASIKYGFWIGTSKEGKPDGYFTYSQYKPFYPRSGSVYKNDGCTHICNYYFSELLPISDKMPGKKRNVFYSKAPQTKYFFPKATKICINGVDDGTLFHGSRSLYIHRYTNPPKVCFLATSSAGKITKNGQVIAVYYGPDEGAAAAAAIFFKW